MHKISKFTPLLSKTSCSRLLAVRCTSAGPPAADPSKPGSMMHKYESFIGRWPKALELHRTVMNGSRWCFSDVKAYIKVKRSLANGSRNINDLSIEELETLVQMSVEGPKIAIITAVLPLPLTVYVFGFAIIFFPRLVLTRHFWSDEQRRKFFQHDVGKALESGRELMKQLEVKGNNYDKLKEMESLDFSQKILLYSLQSMYPLPFAQRRIAKRQEALRKLDEILPKYIDNMNERQLVFHCFVRKIEIGEKKENELRKSLNNYLKLAKDLPDSAYLYVPALLDEQK